MRRILCCVVLLAVGASSGHAGDARPPRSRLAAEDVAALQPNATQDPLRLLLLSAAAEDAEAERLRQQVNQLLPTWKRTANAADLRRLAKLLPQTVHTPTELKQVLGQPLRLARQLLHRRYLEQWTYDEPPGMCVVWDCPRGQPPRLAAVYLLDLGKK